MLTVTSNDNTLLADLDRASAEVQPAFAAGGSASMAVAIRRTAERRAAQAARGRRIRFAVLLPVGVVGLAGFAMLTSMMTTYFLQAA
ncbi:hypothetical protein DSM112329_00763 [Paraconexibacter sp. AEG42_29]|uniref:Uncharacterized protein n=1 Tax=Paraconexibacter sp. AEG42_29 TaxID=2997339 RepID=A0AAU7AQK7_9ACTN